LGIFQISLLHIRGKMTFDDDLGASLVGQLVKNLPAMQETRVRSLGREDLLENGTPFQGPGRGPRDMSTWSSILYNS